MIPLGVLASAYVPAAAVGSQWVAVGDTGNLTTSPDGVTWTQRTSGFGTSIIQAVAHN